MKVWLSTVLLLTTGIATLGVAFVATPVGMVYGCSISGNCAYLLGWSTVGTPAGVAVDSSGNVYVVELGHPYNRVDEWTGAGSHIGNPLFTFSAVLPMGIAVDSSGNVYIVDNQFVSPNYGVLKFANTGGSWSLAKQWGTYGTGTGQLTDPIGIAVNPSGTYVYVTDLNSYPLGRVQKFDSSGNFVLQWSSGPWGGPVGGPDKYLQPQGIAVDSSGTSVYVVNTWNALPGVFGVVGFDTNGGYVSTIGSQCDYGYPSTLCDPGKFMDPTGVAVDPSGNVYVTDPYCAMPSQEYYPIPNPLTCVQRFSQSDPIVLLGSAGSGAGQFGHPYFIAADSNGNVYVTDNTRNRVLEFGDPGTATSTSTTTTTTTMGWQVVPSGFTDDSPAMAYFNSRLYAAVKARGGTSIYLNSMNLNTQTWSGWTAQPGSTPNSTALTASSSHLYLVVRGSDNRIYWRRMTTGSVWTNWQAVPTGSADATPAAAFFNNHLYLSVKGYHTTGIYVCSMDAGTLVWSGWTAVSGATISRPALAASSSYLYITVRGSDNHVYWRRMTTAGAWSASWISIPSGTIDTAPSTTFLSGHLYVGVKGYGSTSIYEDNMSEISLTWSGWVKQTGSTSKTPALTAYSTYLCISVMGSDYKIYWHT